MADHWSRMSNEGNGTLQPAVIETFPDEQLLAITGAKPESMAPWYADIVNFLVCKVVHP